MGKAPAFQFYIRDWLSDPLLKMVSHTTKGIWIDLLCYLWESPERGKLQGSHTHFIKMIGCTPEEWKQFCEDASVTQFANVTNSNNAVTVCNRRMFREENERKNTRLRVQRHRERKTCNENVTPSSSSSPSSSLNYPKKERFQIPNQEQITESSVPKIKEYLQEICDYMYEKEIFKKAHAFKNKMLKENKSERAILHTLIRCYQKKEFNTTPWAYCMKIMQVENGNYNEYEYRKDKS